MRELRHLHALSHLFFQASPHKRGTFDSESSRYRTRISKGLRIGILLRTSRFLISSRPDRLELSGADLFFAV